MRCWSTCGFASLRTRSSCVVAPYVAGPMRGQHVDVVIQRKAQARSRGRGSSRRHTEEEAMTGDPIVELDAGFSAEDGRATPWATALELLEKAEVFWLSTVRVDGRPHVTPLVG